MKTFQFNYENTACLRAKLSGIKDFCTKKNASQALFHIFSELPDREKIGEICAVLEETMPDALWFGCSTNGNITNGVFTHAEISIICTVFEYASTRVELLQYDISEENMESVAEALLREVGNRPWVTSVEMLTTVNEMSLTPLCDILQHLREDISVFGGAALDKYTNPKNVCVFSKKGGFTGSGTVFILYGGSDLHVATDYVSGWKPLGRQLKITRCDGKTLYELDHKPASTFYSHYLNIKNDKDFFINTLEFPLRCRYNGTDVLRTILSCNNDGSLAMTSDMQQQSGVYITYGEPKTILKSVEQCGKALESFCPETVIIYSCIARLLYWGDTAVNRESESFQDMAPTYGFFTYGEFIRSGHYVNQHNVTLVITGMREGAPQEDERRPFNMDISEHSGKVSLSERLSAFIGAATEELVIAARALRHAAITDPLTGLYNRGEIQKRINNLANTSSLLMIDLDDFKHVNDRFGHQAGDDVLTGLADLLREILRAENLKACAGRWGGEEFMILLPGTREEQAVLLADKIRKRFAEIDFEKPGRQTMSIGVTQSIPGEDADTLCMRADSALYAAKGAGKNRIAVRRGNPKPLTPALPE